MDRSGLKSASGTLENSYPNSFLRSKSRVWETTMSLPKIFLLISNVVNFSSFFIFVFFLQSEKFDNLFLVIGSKKSLFCSWIIGTTNSVSCLVPTTQVCFIQLEISSVSTIPVEILNRDWGSCAIQSGNIRYKTGLSSVLLLPRCSNCLAISNICLTINPMANQLINTVHPGIFWLPVHSKLIPNSFLGHKLRNTHAVSTCLGTSWSLEHWKKHAIETSAFIWSGPWFFSGRTGPTEEFVKCDGPLTQWFSTCAICNLHINEIFRLGTRILK